MSCRSGQAKESCVEPILAVTGEYFLEWLRDWPRELSLQEHFTAELGKITRTPEQVAEDMPRCG